MVSLDDIDLVIFDCDGVLVDSEPLSNEVLACHATTLGWPMDGSLSQSIFKGMTMQQVHIRIEQELGLELDNAWIEDYYYESFALFEQKLEPIPNVANLIKRVVSRNKKICVASQGPHRKMALTLRVTGLENYFGDYIFSARDVERPKPYPDLFLHAANEMEVSPERCCIIEDSLTGVKAAHAAGMHIIFYNTAREPLPSTILKNMINVYEMDAIFP